LSSLLEDYLSHAREELEASGYTWEEASLDAQSTSAAVEAGW
jgi:hypothetical protein